TWNEVGHLDAVHVKFSVQKSNEVANNVKVSGIKIGTISWVEDNTELTITDFKEEEKEETYELVKSADMLKAGDDVVVVLKFMPEEYKVLRVSLLPCSGAYEIADIDDIVKDIILRPGKETVVYWTVNINPNLPENYNFNCPLTINSRLLKSRTIDLAVNTAKKNNIPTATVTTEVLSNKITLGNAQTISVILSNVNGGDVLRAGIVTDNDVIEQTTIGNGRMDFRFTPTTPGKNEIVAYTSTGFVEYIEFDVSEIGDVFIDDITAPEFLRTNEKTNATITIKNNRNTMQTVKLSVSSEDIETVQTLTVLNKKTINVPLSFEKTGMKKITVTIKVNELEQEISKQIEVYDLPKINIQSKYDYDTKEGIILLDVLNYQAHNVSVDFSNKKIDVGDVLGKKEVRVNTTIGTHTATIIYTDASGKEYVLKQDLVFEDESIIQKIIRMIKEFIGSIKVM
ncbi:MAG: hypothetical protein KAS12_06365, partial [Candidatus Aenigmarchaeota archaeon]|nr:hypothetical protein [Candidatus Aenigmarchaeota archaeon]